MTKKREVYNEIKYGLCELFPTEHGNFMINNSDCSFTYSKFSDSGKILFYGEMSIGDKIEFSVFRTREDCFRDEERCTKNRRMVGNIK